jgi:hypothetical protein
VNPLPQSKQQLKKARKIKQLHKEERKQANERDQWFKETRAKIIQDLSKE